MATETLTGREILAVGVWNGEVISGADLDGIVTAFDSLNLSGRIPIKLGHDGPDARDNPHSQFALGWITRVYRQGRKLLADMQVPQKVATWIRDGMLRFVSVELLRDVKAGSREVPWVLDAVALLGADQPAVGILEPLATLGRRSVPQTFSRRVCFSRANAILLEDSQTASGGKPTTMTVNYARKPYETEKDWEQRVRIEMSAAKPDDPDDAANRIQLSAQTAAKSGEIDHRTGRPKAPDQIYLEKIMEEFRRNPDVARAWQIAPGKMSSN